MKLKNISEKEINVNGQLRIPDTIFESDESNEIKNLIKNKYLEEIQILLLLKELYWI